MPPDNAIREACALIRRFEGFRPDAYPDPATGGDPWTIGYGATGVAIIKGTRWTRQQAEDDLALRVRDICTRVLALVKPALPDRATAALASLTYNVGAKAFEGSTLLRKLNAGDTQGAAREFPRWNKADGKVFPGLIIRRAAEQELFTQALGLPKA